MKGGLPAAPVSWIVVQKQTHDLVVSTYGRGFYIMEDLTPLEQGVTPETVTAAVQFITPKPTLSAGACRARGLDVRAEGGAEESDRAGSDG